MTRINDRSPVVAESDYSTTRHSQTHPPTVVAKVGGSLLDLPDLGSRLQCHFASIRTPRVIVMVGGGSAGRPGPPCETEWIHWEIGPIGWPCGR